MKDYRPVNILNCFLNCFLNEQLLPFVNRPLSELMSAYRTGYSANHVLIRIARIWSRF